MKQEMKSFNCKNQPSDEKEKKKDSKCQCDTSKYKYNQKKSFT